MLPLLGAVLVMVTLGGALAYLQFWQSGSFTMTVDVSAILDMFCNLENPEALDRVESGSWPWVYTGLTVTPDWLGGDMIRIMANYETTTIAGDEVYLNVLASGSFITAGGKAKASIQKMLVRWDATSHVLLEPETVGGPIVVNDVSVMSPVLLTDLTKSISEGIHSHIYYEITVSYSNGPSAYGSYDLNIVLDLSDGT